MDEETRRSVDEIAQMKSFRYSHEGRWEELLQLYQPFRGEVTTRDVNLPKKPQGLLGIYDSTGPRALSKFTGFLKGALFPSGEMWHGLSPHPDFAADEELRDGLTLTSRKMLWWLSRSNFYNIAMTMLRDFAGFGNSVVLPASMKSRKRPGTNSTFGGWKFHAIPFIKCYWVFDGPEMLAFAREFEMPKIKAVRFFEALGARPGKFAEGRAAYDRLCYMHYWRLEDDGSWTEQYLSTDKHELLVSRKRSFCPYIVSRWEVMDGDHYGTGLCDYARLETRSVNLITKRILMAMGKDLDPPIIVENDSFLQLHFVPGAQVIMREDAVKRPEYLMSNARYDVAELYADKRRMSIREVFMADLIDEPETQTRSAEEAANRKERALQLISPYADNISSEFLDGISSICLEQMLEKNEVPELKAALQAYGTDGVDTLYDSPLFRAARQRQVVDVIRTVRALAEVSNLTQNPAAIQAVDMDGLIEFFKQNGQLPPEAVLSKQELNELQERTAQKMTLQEMQAQRQAVGA